MSSIMEILTRDPSSAPFTSSSVVKTPNEFAPRSSPPRSPRTRRATVSPGPKTANRPCPGGAFSDGPENRRTPKQAAEELVSAAPVGTCEQIKKRGGDDAGNPSATTSDTEMRSKSHRPYGIGHWTVAPTLLLLHDATGGIASSERLVATVQRSERGQIQFFGSLLACPRVTSSTKARTFIG